PPPHLYTLSLHDALPISIHAELLEIARRPAGLLGDFLARSQHPDRHRERLRANVELELPVSRLDVDHEHRLPLQRTTFSRRASRSEEHTSELQSRFDLVC